MTRPFLNWLLDIHSPAGHGLGTCWCQRPTRRDRIRRYLGTDNLEDLMSEITDALNRLASQVNAVSAAQATSFANLQNAITRLQNTGLDDEQRALVQQIEQSLTKLGEDAQRADDGHEPADDPEPLPEPGPGDDEDVLPDTGR